MIHFQDVGMHFESKAASSRKGSAVDWALSHFNFTLSAGDRVGLVGQSGSGKTTVGRLMVGLIQPSSGEIQYNGTSSKSFRRADWRRVHQHYRMIFQNARNTFDPAQTVGETLAEGFRHHRRINRSEAYKNLRQLLPEIDLTKEILGKYPHQASLGQLKRLSILRVISGDTRAIIADEPTAGLDPVSAGSILDLLKRLNQDRVIALLVITHDLDMVLRSVDRLCVLYQGRIMEQLPVRESNRIHPLHPYTLLLSESSRGVNISPKPPKSLESEESDPGGCAYRERCEHYLKLGRPNLCRDHLPLLQEVEPNHWTACHFYSKIGGVSSPPVNRPKV